MLIMREPPCCQTAGNQCNNQFECGKAPKGGKKTETVLTKNVASGGLNRQRRDRMRKEGTVWWIMDEIVELCSIRSFFLETINQPTVSECQLIIMIDWLTWSLHRASGLSTNSSDFPPSYSLFRKYVQLSKTVLCKVTKGTTASLMWLNLAHCRTVVVSSTPTLQVRPRAKSRYFQRMV